MVAFSIAYSQALIIGDVIAVDFTVQVTQLLSDFAVGRERERGGGVLFCLALCARDGAVIVQDRRGCAARPR